MGESAVGHVCTSRSARTCSASARSALRARRTTQAQGRRLLRWCQCMKIMSSCCTMERPKRDSTAFGTSSCAGRHVCHTRPELGLEGLEKVMGQKTAREVLVHQQQYGEKKGQRRQYSILYFQA